MIFAALSAVLSKIPAKLIAWVFLVVALVCIGFFWGRHGPVKELAEYKAAQEKVVAEVGQKSAEATTKTVTEYVDKSEEVKAETRTIIKKVPVYVPRNVCVLPPSFRSLHDAAASGSALPETP